MMSPIILPSPASATKSALVSAVPAGSGMIPSSKLVALHPSVAPAAQTPARVASPRLAPQTAQPPPLTGVRSAQLPSTPVPGAQIALLSS